VVTTTRLTPDGLRSAVEAVPDPEVPVLSIADLGILRDLLVDEEHGSAEVVITPTYSGCPAMEAITAHVAHVCRAAGWEPRVTTRLSPAWTTDWMSQDGKEKLRRFGIAAPSGTRPTAAGPVPVALGRRTVACPRCGSDDTTELARFGSTACKSLRRCESCREPFDEFKTL
jgi:ring-1,2-phenylacetyl-CoA epoxidase subunit PaaD